MNIFKNIMRMMMFVSVGSVIAMKEQIACFDDIINNYALTVAELWRQPDSLSQGKVLVGLPREMCKVIVSFHREVNARTRKSFPDIDFKLIENKQNGFLFDDGEVGYIVMGRNVAVLDREELKKSYSDTLRLLQEGWTLNESDNSIFKSLSPNEYFILKNAIATLGLEGDSLYEEGPALASRGFKFSAHNQASLQEAFRRLGIRPSESFRSH
jgi:hypothetical protein